MAWTGESIKGEGNNFILVTLFDLRTGEAVKSGPEASAKVEIVILDGSFDNHDWTEKEFTQNIIKKKNGKNILKGNAFLNLKEGTGLLGDLSIVHNEKWKRVSMLRLGARLVDNFQNIRVKEAKTETFTMKDKRMKANRKNVEVLSIMDNVWCLKHIGKRGPIVDRLTEKGIETIKDFLSLYSVRPEELQRILGRCWSTKKLKATVDHALKCKNLEKRYLASHPNSKENYGVVFTEVFNVLGIVKERQFIPCDQLPETLKCDASNRVKSAFDNKEDGVVWDETIVPPLVSPTCASNGPFSSSCSLSSIMGEDVSSEAADGGSVLSGEEHEQGEVDRNGSSVLDLSPLLNSDDWANGGRIFSSVDDLCDAIAKNEVNWSCVFRVPSFNNEDQVYLL